MAISASEARTRLFPLIQQVNDDHTPVRISSRAGDAVLMSAEDYDSWQATIHLLRSPANARRLMEAVARDKSGTVAVAKTEEACAAAGLRPRPEERPCTHGPRGGSSAVGEARAG